MVQTDGKRNGEVIQRFSLYLFADLIFNLIGQRNSLRPRAPNLCIPGGFSQAPMFLLEAFREKGNFGVDVFVFSRCR